MAPDSLWIAATGCCLLAGAFLLSRGQASATAWWLLACAVAVPLPHLPQTSPSFTASLALAAVVPAFGAVAGLCWPTRRANRLERWSAAGAVVVAAGLGGLVPALVNDPRAAGCNRCPANLLGLRSDPGALSWLTQCAAVLTVVWGLSIALLATAKWVAAPRLVRRHTWPMHLGGAAIALLAAVQAAHTLDLSGNTFDRFRDGLLDSQLALLVLMCGGIWFRLTLPGRTGSRVARAILTATPTAPVLIESLSRAVGDPGLTVTYNRLDGRRIDLHGHPVPAPVDSAALRLTRDGAAYAEISYESRLGSTEDLVRAVATRSGLALEHLAAQARLRSAALEAVEARQRIVLRADAERRRLERDLHDGAQQGLITLSLQLTRAASTVGFGRAEQLRTAQRETTEALQDLRSIARGLFPVSLAEVGVRTALRELGDHTAVPLLVDGNVGGPRSAETDTAIYHLVLDVVNGTPAGADAFVHVTLSGGGDGPALVVIRTPPADPVRSRGLVLRSEDRLMALGGTLTIAATEAALTLEGEIPCGS